MITFYTFDENFIYSGEIEVDPMLPLPRGTTIMPVGEEGSIFKWYGNSWIIIDELPPVPETILFPVEELINKINEKRDSIESSGFPYLNKIFDSDPRSVQRINTVVQTAQVAMATNTPFEISWTTADNSIIVLSIQDILGIPVALALYANALHQHASSLKNQVRDALTDIDRGNINIYEGWPGLDQN